MMSRLASSVVFSFLLLPMGWAESIAIWPDLAPGENSKHPGESFQPNPDAHSDIDRVRNVRFPTLDVYSAKKPNGTGVLILPGGGFRYVVPNLEGSEAAEWLNELGVSAFVLRYRTKESVPPEEPLWKRPLQDTQRAIRLLRANASTWNLDVDRIGLLAFSAGGQVGAIAHTNPTPRYTPIDGIDDQELIPSFSMLVYPWRILQQDKQTLLDPIRVSSQAAPAFIVHTHDDQSTSVGAAKLYIDLKNQGVPAELHIYQNGGHGYGTRPRRNSVISTWTDRATDWMRIRGYLSNHTTSDD